MEQLETLVDELALANDFGGIVRIDHGQRLVFEKAYGLADRSNQVPMTVETRLAMASGSKTVTALVVMGLVADGLLELSTTARSVLGTDLPLIAPDVTIEHLLSHRSGIGDYLDEEGDLDVDAYVLPVPVHELATTPAFLPLLDGFPTKFAAGERFAYCNAGYVVLAVIAERVSGVAYADLVQQRVCVPAGMALSGLFRSDALPQGAAHGYIAMEGEHRTNIFHLPVVGTGDGGMYTTAADVHRFWAALYEGRIVAPKTVAEMTRPRSDAPDGDSDCYGLGFWVSADGAVVEMIGGDAGVSFRSAHKEAEELTYTVIGNTAGNAWRIAAAIRERIMGRST